jgi:hypothetical protein
MISPWRHIHTFTEETWRWYQSGKPLWDALCPSSLGNQPIVEFSHDVLHSEARYGTSICVKVIEAWANMFTS